MKHWLLSPRLFILVKMLCPKNPNILVFGDPKWGSNFTLCPTNGPRNYPACWQLPIQPWWKWKKPLMSLPPVPSVPQYPCAVQTSHPSQSKCFPTSLTNVYSCFTNPNPWKIEITSLWCPLSYLEVFLSNSSLVLLCSLQQLLTETQEWKFITSCIILSCFGIFFCRDKTFPNFLL